jgi:hypothetical protein
MVKDQIAINSIYPFLESFPFSNEYEMKLDEPRLGYLPFDEDEDLLDEPSSATLVFKHRTSPVNIEITIPYDEMWWINESSGSIKKLNKIAKTLDKGIKTNNILTKRDIAIEADVWLNQLNTNKGSLSREIFNDAINSLVGQRPIAETVALVNSINKLYLKQGLVKLSPPDAAIIMTFLHFRIIYTKLILGIVIASKISM